MDIFGRTITRRELDSKVGHLRQIGGTRHFEYSMGKAKGVDAVEFNTGNGLVFTLLPGRGLDIADCTYKGINLVYLTPNGVSHPSFYNPAGFEWLYTFFGGLLTTCGLTYFGDPERDGDRELGLHGRYAGLPASVFSDTSRWEGDEYVLEVSGIMEEASLFGEKLRLNRSVTSRLGWKKLIIRDKVENFGSRSSPLNILYHINCGYPLLDESGYLELTAIDTEAYDENAERHLDEIRRFSQPSAGFVGQDFLHTMAGDAEGYALAAMINPRLEQGVGLYLKFRKESLPYLNEWKMLGAGDYVTGIEPVNTKTAGLSTLKKEHRLPWIEPGETREMEVEIGVLYGMREINGFSEKVKDIIGGSI